MMHYHKSDNIEKEIRREELPFDDCLPPGNENFLWMHVKGGTKTSNVMTFAKSALEKGEHRAVVWSGSGGGVVKTVSCAEILKRSFPLYQVNRMCYATVEELWKPQLDGLEEIVVTRQVPAMHILMSLDQIADGVSGLQKPNTTTDFWHESRHQHNQAQKGTIPNPRPFGSGGTRKKHHPNTQAAKHGDQQQKQQPKSLDDAPGSSNESPQQQKPRRNQQSPGNNTNKKFKHKNTEKTADQPQ